MSRTNERKRRADPFERFRRSGFVRWSELSEEAKHRLLTDGHPSNCPTDENIAADECRYRPDGSGWIAGFAF